MAWWLSPVRCQDDISTITGALCNIGYMCPTKTHLKLKSRLPITHALVDRFCTEHGSITAMLYAIFHTDWTIGTDVMEERDFARFEFKMSFGRISYIAQYTWVVTTGLGNSTEIPVDWIMIQQIPIQITIVKIYSAKWRLFRLGVHVLTYCDQMTPYGDMDLGEHGSGIGLLPDDSKPSPELTLSLVMWCGIPLREIPQGLAELIRCMI